MRTDHYAYQRGTGVAAFGLLVQVAIGLTLLIFGILGNDLPMGFASIYVLLGCIVWLSLIVIFHQHKLERLEALEEDEMSVRSGSESVFETSPDETRVAARRLALMHRWMMPAASLGLAGLLALLAWGMIGHMRLTALPAEAGGVVFQRTPYVGWAAAICLGFALIAFIFSRFVAGMAKLPAWQNLRGGAGYMVGNAVVLLAVAVGLGFRVFGNEEVIVAIAWAIPVYMLVVAAEIVLNFVLNLYRPRVPGEVPRPAFDSRVLSLLAAPDSIVRSINEAVNYQFGFDITSSWGYQLLVRSFVWLIALGAGVLILLNTIVIVEPHQQALRLSWGKQIGEVRGSGIMWKRPWPLETASVHDVSSIRELSLTARQIRPRAVTMWTDSLRAGHEMDREIEPFIVSASLFRPDADDEDDLGWEELAEVEEAVREAIETYEEHVEADDLFVDPDQVAVEDHAVAAVSRMFALVDSQVTLQYRIREDGLEDFLTFAPETVDRRTGLSVRERALRALALREVTQEVSRRTLDEVLGSERAELLRLLHERIQKAFDEHRAGVELVSVNIPWVRPSGDAAGAFEELAISHQNRQNRIAMAQREVVSRLTIIAGDPSTARRSIEKIETWERLMREHGPDSPEALEQRAAIERLLLDAGGMAGRHIVEAERDRWVQLMGARAQASRTRGQAMAYRAAPELYRQRELMRVLTRTVAPLRKYVIGIEPSRINVGVDMKELSPLLDFSPGDAGDR